MGLLSAGAARPGRPPPPPCQGAGCRCRIWASRCRTGTRPRRGSQTQRPRSCRDRGQEGGGGPGEARAARGAVVDADRGGNRRRPRLPAENRSVEKPPRSARSQRRWMGRHAIRVCSAPWRAPAGSRLAAARAPERPGGKVHQQPVVSNESGELQGQDRERLAVPPDPVPAELLHDRHLARPHGEGHRGGALRRPRPGVIAVEKRGAVW